MAIYNLARHDIIMSFPNFHERITNEVVQKRRTPRCESGFSTALHCTARLKLQGGSQAVDSR